MKSTCYTNIVLSEIVHVLVFYPLFVLHFGRMECRRQIHTTVIIVHHTAWDLMKKHPTITRGEVWSK